MIYTKKGDKGSTSLVDGKRVFKSELRIDVYGDVDELNSFLGLLRAEVTCEQLKRNIHTIQEYLFVIGAHLATIDENVIAKLPTIDPEKTKFLELEIDKYSADISPLRKFIIYGENRVSSIAHIARAVARRSERKIVKLSQIETVDPEIITFINRLSDYLFQLGRILEKR